MARRTPKPKNDKPADDGGVQTAARGTGGGKVNKADNAPAQLDAATYQHHVEMIQSCSLDLDEKLREVAGLRGVLANAKKAAKKAGVPADTVMKALGLKKRPAGEVVAEFRDIGRILKILDAPLGTQWGLFTDVETVDVMDADAAGYHAGKNNEPASNNPHQAGTEEFAKWKGGWDRWVAEAVPGAKKGGDAAKAKLDAEFEQEGRDAYKAGISLADNPYAEGLPANPLWNKGWKVGQTESAGEMPPIPANLRRGKAAEGAAGHA